jgi:hypothetical protein
MEIPLLSIFTLLTEVVVTSSVLFIIYKGNTEGRFLRGLAWWTLAYDIGVNVAYMLFRALGHVADRATAVHSPMVTTLAIFHGIFSLLMLCGLILFFIFAGRAYARGVNFFRNYFSFTVTFVLLWGLSMLTGVMLFVFTYLF